VTKEVQILYYIDASMARNWVGYAVFWTSGDEISWTIQQNYSHRHDLARTGRLGTLTA